LVTEEQSAVKKQLLMFPGKIETSCCPKTAADVALVVEKQSAVQQQVLILPW
jgi:hypothetical protein